MWTFRDPIKAFEKETGKGFAFLEKDFGCGPPVRLVRSEDVSLTYTNATTGVEVSYEQSYPGIFVTLARLQSGKFPARALFVRDAAVVDRFSLEDLVALHAPDEAPRYEPSSIWNPAEVKRIVGALAGLTRKHAGNILGGDFSEFPALERIVRKRASEAGEAGYPRVYKVKDGRYVTESGPPADS